ncbi:hypothetical protein FK514_28330, partial [Klebsiella pneumoniae]|nr:hypothetical protein [Klebsiella pneumoniae]
GEIISMLYRGLWRPIRLYLPAWKLSTVKTPIREGLGRVLRDKRFVTYVLTLTGYYMLAVQVMLMLPIMVNDIAGSPAAVKWMYAIEAFAMVLGFT